MRTTLDIDDGLLMQAKSLAIKEHTSLTRVIEESLSLRLRPTRLRAPKMTRRLLPVYEGRGGLQPTVRDSLTLRALLDAADGVAVPK
ncbi:MAG: hypothetical protein RJA63_1614 [Pseudomonadota bacterium]|jgi:hypothetical protein